MRRISIFVLLVILALMVWYSLHLASMRIYQVDECTEVYVARTLTMDSPQTNLGHVTLFQVLLSPFLGGSNLSADLFTAARFVMVELFWLNLVLIALATGEKLFSLRGLIALIGAATLAPLWDYGVEIRHDNLMLTGLLLIWCMARLRPMSLQSYFIIGALAGGLEFVAFKSFAYTIPISFICLMFPPPTCKLSRWKLVSAWLIGATGTVLAIRIILGAMGVWELFMATNHALTDASSGGHRFWPWKTLARLLGQTPLLLALVLSGIVTVAIRYRLCGKKMMNWNEDVPEAFLFLIALGVLMINPAPFPYNLLFLVPFAYVFAFKFASALWTDIPRQNTTLATFVVAVMIFAHLIPFSVATLRHLDWTNYRQVRLMYLTERLTDPAKDKIFDGIGMVTTRTFDPRWLLHSFAIDIYLNPTNQQMRELLAENPPAIVMPNYRTDWLPEEDHTYITNEYVPLADDLWVLGKILPVGGGSFEIIHPGRYRISSLEGSDIKGTYSTGLKSVLTPPVEGKIKATLDGVPFSNEPVSLAAGLHRIECATDCQPAVVWVGPKLSRVGQQGEGNHRRLFFNWY